MVVKTEPAAKPHNAMARFAAIDGRSPALAGVEHQKPLPSAVV